MKYATGNSRKSLSWTNSIITLEKLELRLSTTIRTTETVEEYLKMDKPKQSSIKDVGGFVGGHLKNGRRRSGMVLCRSMITLDMDHCPTGVLEDVVMKLPFMCLCHSTHKHKPSSPRLRLIIPISQEISEEKYPAVARMVAKEIGIDLFDDSTYEPHRLMYWPSTSIDGEYIFYKNEGDLLDPDAYLSKYDDWQDISTWPVSSRKSTLVMHDFKEQSDPLLKEGVVGVFCRAYTISDVILKLLSSIYEPSAMENRYDYIPASSSAGVVVYDDKFVYSHHATDPACGKLLNSFDLVRLHLYSHLDEKVSEDTKITKLPSYKAMVDFTLTDENIKLLLAKERYNKAVDDFAYNTVDAFLNSDDKYDENNDWHKKLQYEPHSTILKNNLHNITLILQNDPNLKSMVFNQQLDGIEIKGKLPWNAPSKYWRDADDAQLISYIDSHFGTFSQRNYQISVTKVTDDRSYHPIRDFLDNLPPWDNVSRVDTLLIDYLGATDNAYVRSVTRKTLCAAVCRVKNPGCKFDSMLVLNGPQGIGKSTLISKLAGEWFSDSLNLNDTKDKTAAEKLQGYWIMEIGELAGLRRADVETLRSFLSRQNDIYRAAFGKRATPHLRQCIFFGTTNADSGYLRDTTGNRRFWPLKTPGNGVKKSWDITQDEILQIWAETIHYVDLGEKLYLDISAEELAKIEQRDAMESDEREGIVKDFLDMLLPDNWADMDLYERRNFINNSDFNNASHVGTVKRTSICNMEIWCECFGRERSHISRVDSNELTSILIRLGWKRVSRKQRTPLYGPQYNFVPNNALL